MEAKEIGLYKAVYKQKTIEKLRKDCILCILKEGDFTIIEIYIGLTLTPIAVKIYNTLRLNRVRPELEKNLRKNQNRFQRNRSKINLIMIIRQIMEGVWAKITMQ